MSVTISLQLLRAGFCRHLECIAARGGRLTPIQFPALCGLIRHPTAGWILYDTGYADHFFSATQRWPERIYRATLPVQLPAAEVLSTQLAHLGIGAGDIRTVVVSHYHGDHIAGLRDFPNARFVALRADTQHIQTLIGTRWRAALSGKLPALLPTDYFARLREADASPSCSLPRWLAPFEMGFDLFGDGSLVGVPLPGHSGGQLGLFLPDVGGRPAFLVADACWSLPACREGRLPSRLVLFINADRRHFVRTFFGLQQIAIREPAVALLPSHCAAAWDNYRASR